MTRVRKEKENRKNSEHCHKVRAEDEEHYRKNGKRSQTKINEKIVDMLSVVNDSV